MTQKRWKAYFYVTIQFSMLILLLASGPWISREPAGLLIEAGGLIIGITAIVQMRPGNFNITPLPKKGGQLVTHGLYQYIRHPMYLAQLIVFIPLIHEQYTHYRLAFWLILLVNLVFKLRSEEKQLLTHYQGYSSYRVQSWRLIPFIW